MKKLLALSMVVLMFAMLVIPSFAAFVQEEDLLNIKFEIKKANTAWAADGVLSEGEYYKVETKPTWFSAATADEANLDYCKTLQPEVWMSWDDKYVYFASVYTVKVHDNNWDADPGSMWYSGAIQMNYAEPMQSDPTYRLEYGVGLSSDTSALLYFPWSDSMGSGYDALASKDFIITNASNLLTYEVRTPWSTFLANPAVAVGSNFGMCIVWSVGVDQDYQHAQLASGCTGDSGKNAGNFAQLTLAAAPEVVTEAPVTEAPAVDAPVVDTPAAQTADIAGIAILAAVVALVGVAVVSKKRV